MFSFSYDAARNLLKVVQQGYWTMAEFENYQRDYLAHHERIRKAHESYRVLADCRDYPVQSTEVGVAFAQLFDRLMSENKGRCAIVTASALNKMQAKRAIPQPNVHVFTEISEATDWLLEKGNSPA